MIAVVGLHRSNNRVPARCYGCDWTAHGSRLSFAAHVASVLVAELEKARTVTTIEQLAALPTEPGESEGVIIKAADGEIYELDDDGTWSTFGEARIAVERIALPAIILWRRAG